MSHKERRRFPRIDTSIEVIYDFGMESFSEYTLNLSQGGLYIKTTRPLEMGSMITVEFTLPGFDHAFQISGKVMWKKAQGNEEGPPGMGIEFIELSREYEEMLLQFVARSQLTQKGY